jgi:serine/threonine-protein kinase
VLYELLTYEKPFGGETLHAVLFKVVTEDPVPITRLNPSLPDALERIVTTALNKDPGQRYPTAEAMASDLESVRKHLSELETRATLRFSRPLLATELLPWYQRRPGLVYGGGAGGLAAILLAVILASGGDAAQVVARPIDVTDTVRAPVAVAEAPQPAAAPAPVNRPPTTRTTTRVSRPQATSRTPPPAPAAAAFPAVDPAVDRARVAAAVERVERVYASGSVERIKAVFPNMASQSVAIWSSYFKGKEKLDADFRMGQINIDGNAATVDIEAGFTYERNGRRATPPEIPLRGILQRTATGWTWISLEGR